MWLQGISFASHLEFPSHSRIVRWSGLRSCLLYWSYAKHQNTHSFSLSVAASATTISLHTTEVVPRWHAKICKGISVENQYDLAHGSHRAAKAAIISLLSWSLRTRFKIQNLAKSCKKKPKFINFAARMWLWYECGWMWLNADPRDIT